MKRKINPIRMSFFIIIFSIVMALIIPVWAETGTDGGEPLVTATFFDSDLREALKEISLQTGIAFICDENVRGIITMDLKSVPLEKALRMMVSGGGFTFRKLEDYYIIGLPDPRNPSYQMLCESACYYFKNVGIDSARALIPDNYKSYIKLDPERGVAMIKAPSSLLNDILKDLAKIDGARAQIRIKALVTEVNNESLKELGMNLLSIDFTKTGNKVTNTTLDVLNGTLTGNGFTSFGSFTTTIKALVNEKKATIHADPEIIVTEGKSGELFVGEKRTLILSSQGTNAITSSMENVEAGTYFKVTPKILGDQIELTVSQKISSFGDDGSPDQISVTSREFSSVVRFLPGQTVMVAGITQKNTRNDTVKTPLLGDIPIIGLLFKQRSKAKADSELLIFLTAEVVKE